ncbi:RNA-directed DNA polymerase, eukaryota, reverse transcriptase zinc-binding domain protein [Tanacetum coccineum]
MERLGFSSTWRKWIMAGLKSSRASILVNGSPTSEFSLKRGLRQGDPLVKIGPLGIRLSHLFYADDVIILSEWNQCDMDNIIRILNVFYLASGLKINISKSNLYWIGGFLFDDIESMAACAVHGVGSLKAFNNSLAFKWRWRLLNKPSALWVDVLKSIHGNEDGIELKGCQPNGIWARIVGTIYHLHSSSYVPLNSLRYQVGLPLFGGLFVVGVTLKSRRYLPVMNGTYGTPRGKLQKLRKT